MKLKLQEDPKEWRKAVWLGCLGFGVMTSLLRWRHVLGPQLWVAILCVLGGVAVTASVRPRLFRGFYRFSHWLSHGITEVIGRIALAFIFIVVVTPLGLVMRMTGKDPLRLRRSGAETSYWHPSPPATPLDRTF